MYFLIEDDDLLEKYNAICNKISTDIQKELDNEPVYNKKLLKAKIISCSDEATNFNYRKVSNVSSNYTCLAVIRIDSAL